MAVATAYRKLETWQVPMAFVESCYRATADFPGEERFGLTSQLRRAAVSIPANIAEGYCRRNPKVYANHISIALAHTARSKPASSWRCDWPFSPTTAARG
jgi:hypothetical protein